MARILQVVERNKASKGFRILNYLIDFGFSLVVIWVLIILFAIGRYYIFGVDFDQSAADIDGVDPTVDRVGTLLMYALVLFFIEKLSGGRSLGKLITGTRVVKTDGSELTTDDLLKRNFSRAIPFDAFSFLGDNGWHDRWSNTRVIRIKDFENARNLEKDIQNIGSKENLS